MKQTKINIYWKVNHLVLDGTLLLAMNVISLFKVSAYEVYYNFDMVFYYQQLWTINYSVYKTIIFNTFVILYLK